MPSSKCKQILRNKLENSNLQKKETVFPSRFFLQEQIKSILPKVSTSQVRDVNLFIDHGWLEETDTL